MDRNAFQKTGAISMPLPARDRWLLFLQSQYDGLVQGAHKPRPWQYSELHNPWGRCATLFDTWGFLELCQSAEIIGQLIPLIGSDIILYDTQLTPDPWVCETAAERWLCDKHRCCVDPVAGLVVRIAFGAPAQNPRKFIYKPGSHLKRGTGESSFAIKPGHMIIHDVKLSYQIASPGRNSHAFEVLIRYFPATSHYLRDASAPRHRALCERYPLLNYARMPLWLVSGTDRADNDFVTGFNPKPGRWIGETPSQEHVPTDT